MPDRDRVCLECGHAYAWHSPERARDGFGSDPTGERVCYRRIGAQTCPCPGFRAGNERLASAPATGSVARSALLALMLVILGLALLYAYRSQTPAIQQVSLTEAVQAVNASQVKAVTITGNKATLDFSDGATRKQTIVPDGAHGDDPLSQAILSFNQANPARAVALRYEQTDPAFSVLGSILLSLLPVLLLGGFFVYMMNTMRRRRDD